MLHVIIIRKGNYAFIVRNEESDQTCCEDTPGRQEPLVTYFRDHEDRMPSQCSSRTTGFTILIPLLPAYLSYFSPLRPRSRDPS
jgi:hypothetical protein